MKLYLLVLGRLVQVLCWVCLYDLVFDPFALIHIGLLLFLASQSFPSVFGSHQLLVIDLLIVLSSRLAQ